METSTLWWIAVVLLLGAELLTGTFFLLMMALAAIMGALSAHLGLGLPAQLIIAALSGSLLTVGWYLLRKKRKLATTDPDRSATRNKLDIGSVVMVEAWQPDGTTDVQYRGARWQAIAANPQQPPVSGRHTVTDIRGSQLVLSPAA
ncbi:MULTISPECIES: NfeD family protein [Brachymonas]|uniref:NfeD family protein n=1 Tax=Brachymonas TaxID=28219 RepID=UPI0016979A03|nr:NfeD family protein [Brachymonas sp. J145]MEE1653184.1 NfeD family protein [Brachymonas sp. J145]NLX15805.1 NfeD family protein [Ramlibacter sp.]